MLRRIPKVLLLVALLAALVASSARVLGASHTCRCYTAKGSTNPGPTMDAINTLRRS